MILIKLLGFAMLIGTVSGSVLGLQIVIDRQEKKSRTVVREYRKP